MEDDSLDVCISVRPSIEAWIDEKVAEIHYYPEEWSFYFKNFDEGPYSKKEVLAILNGLVKAVEDIQNE